MWVTDDTQRSHHASAVVETQQRPGRSPKDSGSKALSDTFEEVDKAQRVQIFHLIPGERSSDLFSSEKFYHPALHKGGMGTGYESKIWICSRLYEAHTGGLDKTSAQRTTKTLKEQGLLARYRVYREAGSPERWYVVYSARPRRISNPYPLKGTQSAE